MKAALIGAGIGPSMSPFLHEAEGRAQGLDYEFGRFDTASEPYLHMSLAEMMAKAEAEGYAGLNITHPFKKQAAALVDELSETAETLGAINTVVFRDGRRIGENTDYVGFRTVLARNLNATDIASVLLLGAGGAGGAVALALLDAGTRRLFIYDRDQTQALEAAGWLSVARPQASVEMLAGVTAADLSAVDGVVNATPMGMAGHPGTAIDPALLPARIWVADIVYFPLETELLARAKARGCRVIDGSGMAIFQAVAAFELITGVKADASRMAKSFRACLRSGRGA